MRRFQQTMHPTTDTTILDVGGHPYNWQFIDVQPRLTFLNRHILELSELPRNAKFVQGDGRSLEYPELSFEIGYSNSVIEHVGSWEDQERFASEIRRVARRIWVQTPSRLFPIEPHYLAPFLHWLPIDLQERLVGKLSIWGWLTRPSPAEARQMVRGIRLLTKAEMKTLFPDCAILTERFFLLPKSYIAIRT